jgi:hypothetical protein
LGGSLHDTVNLSESILKLAMDLADSGGTIFNSKGGQSAAFVVPVDLSLQGSVNKLKLISVI